MAASTEMTALWEEESCSSPVEADRRFRGAYCLRHQASIVALMKEAVCTSETSASTGLHGAVSQKAVVFTVD
jgi:hypothetical protein